MASNNIGNLSIIISGNAAGLTSALTKAQQQVQAFAQKANVALGGAGGRMSAAVYGGGGGPNPLIGGSRAFSAAWNQSIAQTQAKWSAAANRMRSGGQLNAWTRFAANANTNPFARLVGMDTSGPSALGRLAGYGLSAGKAIVGGLAGAVATVAPMIGGAVQTGLHMAVGFAAAAGAAIKHALEKAMDFQQFQMAFEVMTGSAAKGTAMLEKLERFAATVPFEAERVYRSAQKLAGAGVEMENILPALQAMSAVVVGTGGDAGRFENMALAFSQVTGAGKLMGQELRQLTDAGFTVDHIARAMKIDVGEVRHQMEQGAVGVGDLYRAFNTATREGGKFDGILTKMAGTTKGQFLQLQSRLGIATRKIGEGFRQGIENSGVTDLLFGALAKLDEYLPALQAKTADWGNGFSDQLVKISGLFGQLVDDIQPFADALTQKVAKPLVFAAGAAAFLARQGQKEDANLGEKVARALVVSVLPGGSALSLASHLPEFNMHEYRGGLPPEFRAMMDGLDAMKIGPGDRSRTWQTAVQGVMDSLREASSRVNQDFGGLSEQAARTKSALQELADGINKGIEKGVTPFQQFANQVRDIARAADLHQNPLADRIGGMGMPGFGMAGLIDPFARDLTLGQKFLDLEKALDRATTEFPKAMEKGSAEAASAINRELYRTGQEDMQTRVLRVLEQQKANGDRQVKELMDIGRAVNNWQAGQMP